MKDYMDIIREYALKNSIDIYMVGGAVRDEILGREISDYDFALEGDCHKVAIDIGNIIGGSYVNMHENTARVVLEDIILDFSNFKGRNINDDLLKRDFTINSIGKDIKGEKIIDAVNGLEDIKNKIIRATYEGAFRDDPIRMLRAVRLSGELGFGIYQSTKDLIIKESYLIENSSGERIIDEIYKIMAIKESHKYIKLLDELGLLEKIFPIVEPMKLIGKCRYHTVDSYTHSLLTLKCFEDNISKVIESKWGKEIKEHIYRKVGGRPRIYTIKLGTFLHDIGKPGAMRFLDGRVSFRGHDVTGKKEFKKISKSLPMAALQLRVIEDIIVGHMRVLVLYKIGAGSKEIFNFFKEFGCSTIDVLLSALFDFMATRQLLDNDDSEIQKFWNFVMNLIDKYYGFYKKDYKIISGREIIDITGFQGKDVGDMIRRIEEEIFCGNIETKEEIIDFIKNSLG